MMIDPDILKAMRSLLRRVDEHDQHSQIVQGVRREALNMLDVVYHPTSALPRFNYVTPRRGAAWVSVGAVREGITYLMKLDRAPHIVYYEGLLPPLFRQTLSGLGLHWASESHVHICTALNLHQTSGCVTVTAHNDGDRAAWWRLRCAFLTGSALTTAEIPQVELSAPGEWISVRCDEMVVGVARLEIHADLRSAEITAFHPRATNPTMTKLLMEGLLQRAQAAGCDLVFGAEALSAVQNWLPQLGFHTIGSLVKYARSAQTQKDNGG